MVVAVGPSVNREPTSMSGPITNDGIVVEWRQACELCGSPGELMWKGLKDRLYSARGTWSLRRCTGRDCGLVWLDPHPREDQIARLYDGYYTHENTDASNAGPSDWREAFRSGVAARAFGYRAEMAASLRASFRMWRRLGYVLGRAKFAYEATGMHLMWLHAKPGGRLLDVGCGSGAFLRRMEALGWEPWGIEPDGNSVAHMRQAGGLNVRVGTLENADLPTSWFDAITLHHVIEHLPNPRRSMRRAAELLRPGGVIVVATPDCTSPGIARFGPNWQPWDVPRHLQLFNRRTLASCLEQAGLAVRLIGTSARMARGIYVSSSMITDGQRPPAGYAGPGRTRSERLRAMAYHWRQRLASLLFSTGEEVFAIASCE